MDKQQRWENSIPSIAEGLHKSILNKGYGEISDFLPHSALNDVTNFIKEIKVKTGSGDIRLNEDKTIGTCIENLMSPNVKDLMHEILRNSGIYLDKSKYYARVRAKLSKSCGESTYKYHFDRSYLTVTLPILVPSKKDGGALEFIPNIRNKTSKKFIDRLRTKLCESKLAKYYFSKTSKHQPVFYKTNQAFFFHGNNSLHATGKMSEKAKRIVVLLHSGN
tara:strand:- start:1376 stop:2035 length:660 start_codon:yes stop_codon:yes gene_type:complete